MTWTRHHLHYQETLYTILAIRDESLLPLAALGLGEDVDHTATLDYSTQGLALQALKVKGVAAADLRPINGVVAEVVVASQQTWHSGGMTERKSWQDGLRYAGVNLPLNFSGRLLIAADQIPSVILGVVGKAYRQTNDPRQYRQVLRLRFEDSQLVDVTDLTATALALRNPAGARLSNEQVIETLFSHD